MNSTYANSDGQQLSLKDFISKKHISALTADCERFRVFDPVTTLYCFLHQVLTQCSSKGALANLNVRQNVPGQNR